MESIGEVFAFNSLSNTSWSSTLIHNVLIIESLPTLRQQDYFRITILDWIYYCLFL